MSDDNIVFFPPRQPQPSRESSRESGATGFAHKACRNLVMNLLEDRQIEPVAAVRAWAEEAKIFKGQMGAAFGFSAAILKNLIASLDECVAKLEAAGIAADDGDNPA
jgi:hypothetical protein